MKKVYKSFDIAGLKYYEALFVISKLKVGQKLKLKPDVAIYYKKRKLGYIPKNANYSISQILKAGWNIFECYIQTIDRENLAIGVALFVRER